MVTLASDGPILGLLDRAFSVPGSSARVLVWFDLYAGADPATDSQGGLDVEAHRLAGPARSIRRRGWTKGSGVQLEAGPVMPIRTARESRPRRAGRAFLSAASGLAVGVVTYAIASTMRVILDPGVAAGDGPGAWILGSALVFAGALFWALIGGVLLVLPWVSTVWYFPYSLFVLPVLLVSAPTCFFSRWALRKRRCRVVSERCAPPSSQS